MSYLNEIMNPWGAASPYTNPYNAASSEQGGFQDQRGFQGQDQGQSFNEEDLRNELLQKYMQEQGPSAQQRPLEENDYDAPQQSPYGNAQPPEDEEEPQGYAEEDQQLPEGYETGGHVRNNRASDMGEHLRQQGRYGDTMLAHISPLEAMMLKNMGGSGTINPKTGLPEYFNGGNFLQSLILPMILSLAGNALMPGFGAIAGGATGGMFGPPKRRMGPIAGAGFGALAPMLMSGMGAGLTGMGAGSAGGFLSSIAGQTANPLTSFIMPSIVSGGAAGLAGASGMPSTLSAMSAPGMAAAGMPSTISAATTPGFMAQMMTPQNLLAAGSLGMNMMNRPPSLEKQARAQSMAQAEAQLYLDNKMNDPERLRRRHDLQLELDDKAMQRREEQQERAERMKWAPLEESASDYEVEQVAPEEFERTGKIRRKFRKNPDGTRTEVPYERGGAVHAEEGGYLEGKTGGREDKIPAWLSDGEYVMDANTVAALGDGNNSAGAKKLDDFRKHLLKHKGMKKLPPPSKPLKNYF